MVRVEGHRLVRAPVHKVFQLISRLDSQPRVTGLWLAADVLERKSNTVTIQYRGYFGGMPVESTQRATLYPPQRVEFHQTRGALKAFRGEYVLKPIDGETELALTVEAEVGIPLISEASARLILHAFVERSLEKFKLTAERDLPRVQRRPQEAAATAETPPVEPTGAEPPVSEPPREAPRPVLPSPPQQQQAGAPSADGGGPGRRRRRRRRRKRGRRGGGQGPKPNGGIREPGPGSS